MPKGSPNSRSRLVLYEEAASHVASIVTRPMHVPDRGNGGAARFAQEARRESVVAVASGPRAGELRSVHDEAYSATAQVDEGRIVAATNSKALPSYTKETWEAARARTKTRATAPVFLSRADLESARQEESLQELIAASSTVGARVRVRMVIAGAMIVTGVVLAALVHNGLFRPLVLRPNDRLLLTVIQNKTGDKILDGTVVQAARTRPAPVTVLESSGGRSLPCRTETDCHRERGHCSRI